MDGEKERVLKMGGSLEGEGRGNTIKDSKDEENLKNFLGRQVPINSRQKGDLSSPNRGF